MPAQRVDSSSQYKTRGGPRPEAKEVTFKVFAITRAMPFKLKNYKIVQVAENKESEKEL
jgi:hypothetical protein